MKVAIINGDNQYTKLFTNMGHKVVDTNPDLFVFTGGEDVTPSMYGAVAHQSTYFNPRRDDLEAKILRDNPGVPCVGICRGAQFLNVMAGGEMYQDVTDHCRPHSITDSTEGFNVWVTSTHHQMMKPSEKGLLVASSTLRGKRTWWDKDKCLFVTETSVADNEVVYYPEQNYLCFQPHPEMHGESEVYRGMREYFFTLIHHYLGV